MCQQSNQTGAKKKTREIIISFKINNPNLAEEKKNMTASSFDRRHHDPNECVPTQTNFVAHKRSQNRSGKHIIHIQSQTQYRQMHVWPVKESVV